MFRLLAPSGQAVWRPALLQHVRNQKNNLAFQNASSSTGPSASLPTGAVSTQFCRTNLTAADVSEVVSEGKSPVVARAQKYFKKNRQEPFVREALLPETEQKLAYFKEQLTLTRRFQNPKNRDAEKAFVAGLENISRVLEDPLLRGALRSQDLYTYNQMLNFGTNFNRAKRLSGSRNRDSDLYLSQNLHTEVVLKLSVVKMSKLIADGEFESILNPAILLHVLYLMNLFLLVPEMIYLWEKGVSQDQGNEVYLNQRILAVMLPIAFEQKRFSYEEVSFIYKENVEKLDIIAHEVLASMGKIAVAAKDYTRALDSLDALVKIYETSSDAEKRKVLFSLSDLHLTFIGTCKSIETAKHFFEKVVNHEMLYEVKLKAPHVQSLLENCYEQGESMESILHIWRGTIKYYNQDRRHSLNSLYAVVNNTLFQIFFRKFPELNEESHEQLRQIIAIYSEVKPVDEIFLNAVIGNYSWNNKEVLEQLIENYEVYDIDRTPVPFRVCLKKTGEVAAYTNEEILQKWNESLRNLDEKGFTYIPVADWAALRDATILSPMQATRKEFYLAVVDKYKDYIQDHRSCIRFVRYWAKRLEFARDIERLAKAGPQLFDCETDIQVPEFRSLKKNIDYVREVQKFNAGG